MRCNLCGRDGNPCNPGKVVRYALPLPLCRHKVQCLALRKPRRAIDPPRTIANRHVASPVGGEKYIDILISYRSHAETKRAFAARPNGPCVVCRAAELYAPQPLKG